MFWLQEFRWRGVAVYRCGDPSMALPYVILHRSVAKLDGSPSGPFLQNTPNVGFQSDLVCCSLAARK